MRQGAWRVHPSLAFPGLCPGLGRCGGQWQPGAYGQKVGGQEAAGVGLRVTLTPPADVSRPPIGLP